MILKTTLTLRYKIIHFDPCTTCKWIEDEWNASYAPNEVKVAYRGVAWTDYPDTWAA